MQEPLLEITIPGRAAGKKTSGQIIYPGIGKLGLRKTPRMLSRSKGKRASPLVFGVGALLDLLSEMIPKNPAGAAQICTRARNAVWPRIVPPKSHEKWFKRALATMNEINCPKPIVPDGHMIRCDTVVYMATGQTGDLINFEEAVWDCLQAAEIIATDHWINGHGGSCRKWTEPRNPRIEITLYELGAKEEFQLPKVEVRGLSTFDNSTAPIRFRIAVPDGRELANRNAPRGTKRKKLVLEAMRVWEREFDEDLPTGAVIACGGADATVQGGLF